MPFEFKPAKPQPKPGFFARLAQTYRTVDVPRHLERDDSFAAWFYRLVATAMRISSPTMTDKDVYKAIQEEAHSIMAREARRRR